MRAGRGGLLCVMGESSQEQSATAEEDLCVNTQKSFPLQDTAA